MRLDDDNLRGETGAPPPDDASSPSPDADPEPGSAAAQPGGGAIVGGETTDDFGVPRAAEPTTAPPVESPAPQAGGLPTPPAVELPTPQAAPWAQTPSPWAPPAAPWAPPPPASPWQSRQPGGWAQPGPSPWGSQPSGPTSWPPQPPAPPVWQPGSGWQAGQGWQANQQPPSFGGSGTPPAGTGAPRRPSRLPGYLAVIAACLIAFSGGMVVDHSLFPRTVSSGDQPASSAAPAGSAENSTLYNEALQIIKSRFVGRSSVTDQQLLYGALKGMVDSLGDTGHSTFLTPAQYAAFQQSLSASVAGIGVIMSSANNVFRVDRVIAGSPAAAGGVKVGDTITAVDGTSTTDMTLTDLGSKIRGPAGTKVKITVLHTGSTTPVDITLTRAQINVPLTGWGIVPGTHIADIVLVEFSAGAADQVQQDITAAQKAGATSIILDLRGNPGGYAQEAQDVASEFLSSGTVYIEQDANGNNTDITVDTSRTHSILPLVVLVDHDSASSSEIVAGALQDSGRAKIVGVATFGTGTVLQQFKLSDGSYIVLGTSWWLTPHGHKIFGVGITPDESVPMAAGALPADPTTFGTMTVAQLNASGDAELLAAVKDLSK